jgi:hypothetical protein
MTTGTKTTDTVELDWYIDGKPVGASLNRLNRIAMRFTKGIDGPKPERGTCLTTQGFIDLLKSMGVEVPITESFERLLPNNKTVAVVVKGSKFTPYVPEKPATKSAKASKPRAAKKGTTPLVADLITRQAEAKLVTAWEQAGSPEAEWAYDGLTYVGKPLTPATDAKAAADAASKAAGKVARAGTRKTLTTLVAEKSTGKPVPAPAKATGPTKEAIAAATKALQTELESPEFAQAFNDVDKILADADAEKEKVVPLAAAKRRSIGTLRKEAGAKDTVKDEAPAKTTRKAAPKTAAPRKATTPAKAQATKAPAKTPAPKTAAKPVRELTTGK